MNKNSIIFSVIIIILFLAGCVNPPPKNEGELQKDIEDGKSMMFIEPHPDDGEIFMPGTFAMAGGDHENKCYICCIGSIQNLPPKLDRDARMEAISWFTNTYLEEYIWLNNTSPFKWENIKTQLIDIIEEIKPDILITYTPYGWWGHPEHIATSEAITEIYNRLSYNPKIYYIVNMDQDIPLKPHYEYALYPPTDIINLDVYSSTLGKTYWDAKLEVWEHYALSIPDLQNLLNNQERLQNNDKKEYFYKCNL